MLEAVKLPSRYPQKMIDVWKYFDSSQFYRLSNFIYHSMRKNIFNNHDFDRFRILECLPYLSFANSLSFSEKKWSWIISAQKNLGDWIQKQLTKQNDKFFNIELITKLLGSEMFKSYANLQSIFWYLFHFKVLMTTYTK